MEKAGEISGPLLTGAIKPSPALFKPSSPKGYQVLLSRENLPPLRVDLPLFLL